MTITKRKAASHATAQDSTEAVDAFMGTLEHPFKRDIEVIRATILGVDPSIAEGIKWKAPSFRTTEYFATTNLREKKGIGVILHRGAKVRGAPSGGLGIDDPAGLLVWLGDDRAMVVFSGLKDFEAKRQAFEGIIRQWIAHV